MRGSPCGPAASPSNDFRRRRPGVGDAVMSQLHRITVDPEVCGGRPCLRGLAHPGKGHPRPACQRRGTSRRSSAIIRALSPATSERRWNTPRAPPITSCCAWLECAFSLTSNCQFRSPGSLPPPDTRRSHVFSINGSHSSAPDSLVWEASRAVWRRLLYRKTEDFAKEGILCREEGPAVIWVRLCAICGRRRCSLAFAAALPAYS